MLLSSSTLPFSSPKIPGLQGCHSCSSPHPHWWASILSQTLFEWDMWDIRKKQVSLIYSNIYSTTIDNPLQSNRIQESLWWSQKQTKKFSKWTNEPLNSNPLPSRFIASAVTCSYHQMKTAADGKAWKCGVHPVTLWHRYEPISSEFIGPASDCRDLIAPTKVSWSQPQSGSIPVFACCVCVFWSGKGVWDFFFITPL